MDRTEEQKITQAPIVVALGGKEYEIRPLVICHSSEWRLKFKPLLLFILHFLRLIDADKQEEREKVTVELFTDKMPEIIECFFAYARELNRDEIESIATDGDILMAFLEVIKLFFIPLGKAPQKTK